MKGNPFFSRSNLKKFDHDVLINYPVVWMTKAHYFLLISIVLGNILAVILGMFYPVSLSKLTIDISSNILLEKEINMFTMVLLMAIIIGSVFWGSYLNRSSPRIHSAVKFGLFFLCFTSLAVHFLVFERIVSYRIGQFETDENLERLEDLFHPVFVCDSITYIEKENGVFRVDKRMKLPQIPKCEQSDHLTNAFFMDNKEELGIFLNYVEKYQFAEKILEQQHYRYNYDSNTDNFKDLDLVKRMLRQEDTIVSGQHFPMIIEDGVLNHRGDILIKFLRRARTGPFFLLNKAHQIWLGVLVFFIPILVYWFSHYSILETMISLFSTLVIVLLLLLPMESGINGVKFGFALLQIIAFLYLMRLVLFERGAIQAFYMNIGWSILLLCSAFGLVLAGTKAAIPVGWLIASAIVLYLLLSFGYILFLFQNRASYPSKT